jgi:long-subunit acyl-CoA synthetase (AMP-forming)
MAGSFTRVGTDRKRDTAALGHIDQLNQRLEQFEKVRRFAIIRDDFSDEVRSVTVFQKIKVDRKAVEQRYQKEIEEIYGLAEEGKA